LDIKLRNIDYSSGFKLLAMIIVWLGFLGTIGGCIFWLDNRQPADVSSYTETYSFQSTFSRLLYNTVEYYTGVPEEYTAEKPAEDLPGEDNNLAQLDRIDNEFPSLVNFVYYVHNTETGQTWSNLDPEEADPVKFIQKQPAHAFFNGWTSDHNIAIIKDISGLIADRPYEVYAAVTDPPQPGDVFYDYYLQFNQGKALAQTATNVSMASFFLMALAFIYLIYTILRRDPEEIKARRPVRMYTDLHTLLVFIAAVISLSVGVNASMDIPDTVTFIFLAIILSLDIFIGLFYVLAMAEQIRTGEIFTNTLTYRVCSSMREVLGLAFQGRLFKTWTLVILLGYALINGLLFTLCMFAYYYHGNGTFFFLVFLLLSFNALAIYFAAKSLEALSQIMEAARQISAGNLDYPLDSSIMPVSFASFANDINSLQGGLKQAVAIAIRGERMKTDLITNVSHDLKTPLTSIVNYVDLLKKEDLENERAVEYVKVLEEKSARLKQLIEDLVEASKASSGNLAVSGEKVDLQELIMQSCGEYQEKIQLAELELHIQSPDEIIAVQADGRHMWRIAENLLSNVIKYSMPHSRVYIDIGSGNGYGFFTMKNISSFALNISPEQLTERFVRGDEARSTEGSGLGLAIARSLTELQGGSFQLEIDGDLFKITVALPMWREE